MSTKCYTEKRVNVFRNTLVSGSHKSHVFQIGCLSLMRFVCRRKRNNVTLKLDCMMARTISTINSVTLQRSSTFYFDRANIKIVSYRLLYWDPAKVKCGEQNPKSKTARVGLDLGSGKIPFACL